MSEPVPPSVSVTPSLGRPVFLGELYDQRSEKFLGVQLYPQENIKEVVTDVRRTDLSLSLSTTYQQKATLLDVNPRLSLQALAGLVRAAGSATYLNDRKANTHEYAYALVLKTLLAEKRLLFTEPELGRNVLEVAVQDYISTNKATHFVSNIVYGGGLVVNLAARRSELPEGEIVDGKLEEELTLLKGAINLEGEADPRIKERFTNLDGKFDLVVHSDVGLEKVPINPKDVLDAFPEVAARLTGSGGVPIIITLQPIPPTLYKGGAVYPLGPELVDPLLSVFSDLDDLRSRFVVLQDSLERLRDLVPELARTARVVAASYTKEHSRLLHHLATFILDHQHGKWPDLAPILEDAKKLYESYVDPDRREPEISRQYPSSLVGLEYELSRFQDLTLGLKREGESLQIVERPLYLSTLEVVVRATEIQQKIPLFVATPIAGDNVNPGDTIRKFFAIIRRYPELLNDTTNRAYLFYAENLDKLEHRLPNGGEFSQLANPALFIGEADGSGKLTWFERRE